jgi:hypothetical protein
LPLLYILKIASKSSSEGNKSKLAIPDIKITNCCALPGNCKWNRGSKTISYRLFIAIQIKERTCDLNTLRGLFYSYKKNCKKKLVARVLHIVPEAADDKPLTVFASPIFN